MAIVRIRYVHSFVDKTGRVRFYLRYRHKRWPLAGQPGSSEFAHRYDELKASVVLPKRPSSRIAFGPGTLGWVIEKWIGSDDFKKRKSSTQVLYRRFLDSIRERYGRGLMVDLRERHVRSMRAEFTSIHRRQIAASPWYRFFGSSRKKISRWNWVRTLRQTFRGCTYNHLSTSRGPRR